MAVLKRIALLTESVDAGDALLKYCRIPGQVEIDHDAAGLQIKTRASCIGGEEHAAVGVVGEVDDEVAALGRRYTAMQIFIADAHLVEF